MFFLVIEVTKFRPTNIWAANPIFGGQVNEMYGGLPSIVSVSFLQLFNISVSKLKRRLRAIFTVHSTFVECDDLEEKRFL